ncbi:CinA family protein [Sphingobacterium sp. HMA12]|uniref:CinA family protein n=1 Tax=Sphingobacterium sp. HMA12 TaxID=2050894 RepID=UPI000CEA328B|nr:CinA family protein [Sphingobacterium sp. HMA12]
MNKIQFLEAQQLKQIRNVLLIHHERLAVAESVTTGLLQFACAQMENAMDVYGGGMTAYTLEEKIRLLDVDAEEAHKCDCVSPLIAEQMAVRIASLFHTEWGIATTGYATIVPESRGKLYAFFSIAYQEKIVHSEKVELDVNTKAQDAQSIYVTKALRAFYFALKNQTRSKLP